MDVPVLPGFAEDGSPSQRVADRAARAWGAGGIVGLPTETVYGLAADAQDPAAVGRVYAAKGRPPNHPLIVHVAGAQALDGWSGGHDEAAHLLADAFWPGPLTLVVARSARAGDFITGGQDTVALRCPDHPVARACLVALARQSGDPARGVAAPSANRFGRVSPTRAADVVAELGDRLDPARDVVVDGGPCAVGVESTIVDCTASPPRVLRLGAISQAQVNAVLRSGSTADRGRPGGPGEPVDGDEPGGSGAGGGGMEAEGVRDGGAGAMRGGAGGADSGRDGGRAPRALPGVRAPGGLDSHYAPHARVVLVEPAVVGGAGGVASAPGGGFGTQEGAQPARIAGVGGAGRPAESAAAEGRLAGEQPAAEQPADGTAPGRVGLIARADVGTPAGWTRLASPTDAADYARDLYAALRWADELGVATVVAVLPGRAEGPLADAVRDRLTRAAHGE